ncbi:MAG: NADH-quinone oxidoreductase subunit C [Methanomicrobiaceae archaeon]|uniref:Membrane bound hydrogenase, nife-hydrogenase mbhk n=1 Tax=hydrocarbon metagenome TaxID=938273 RepID=A0A0W8FHB7_9ZZZZ|nr:NADH-quinone oxidoreductase subunit C [Methanomicrobiaceae archaeon]MDD5419948.1 NADH-quinone oxidoreductase subunit C [Methanomicrobiaceae archaeon]
MSEARLTPEEIVEVFTREFGDGIREARITERREGSKKIANYNIWIDIDRDLFRPALEKLMEIHFPHLAVVSGSDLGDGLELLYHFTIYYGTRHGEYTVTFTVLLPKDDLRMPTITDLIPGALFTEREKQEMLGIEIVDIPDSRRLFLPEEFPEGVYPWRKDETGVPDHMVKDLWAVGRPANRPARPVVKKEEQGEVQAEGTTEAAVKGKKPSEEEEQRHE